MRHDIPTESRARDSTALFNYIHNKQKMKRLNLLAILMTAVLALMSCSDTETYAERKEKERNAINRYITNQKIKVISESQFKEQGNTTKVADNEFVLFDNTGVYMQIIREGCGEKIEDDGQSVTVLCRFNEYNISESDTTLQLTNISRYTWQVEKMTVKNTSGTFEGSFVSGESLMESMYSTTAVPDGWLVPLRYIKVGRPANADEEVAKVKLIVPHSQGQSNAAQSVYPCVYELTYQRGL